MQRLVGHLTRATIEANPAPAVLVAAIIELALAKRYQLPEALTADTRGHCLEAIEDQIPVRERHALGLCLGAIGDPRVLELQDPNAYVEVPVGDYRYGDEDKTITLAQAFLLSRYPVTNGQYRGFIEAGGYRNPDWWSSDSWAWREQASAESPLYWGNRYWNAPNLPVVGVSFWEAARAARGRFRLRVQVPAGVVPVRVPARGPGPVLRLPLCARPAPPALSH